MEPGSSPYGPPSLGGRPMYFVHIPKTAGTSIRRMLAQRFHENDVFSPDHAVAVVAPSDLRRFVAIHRSIALTSMFPTRPFVLTFLRDPIERTVSSFHFRREQLGHPGVLTGARRAEAELCARMSLPELARSEPALAARILGNVQTWFLSYPGTEPPHDVVGGGDLDTAKRNLAALDCLGLVERMTDSLAMLCRTLGWEPFPSVLLDNRTQRRPAVAEIDSATRSVIEELTWQDAELYRYAKELFEERLRAAMNRPPTAPPPDGADGPSSVSLDFGDPLPPRWGLYAIERGPLGTYRWTGPDREAWVEVAVAGGRALLLEVHVLMALRPELLDGLRLSVNGRPLPTVRADGRDGFRFRAEVPAEVLAARRGPARVGLTVPATFLPAEVDPSNADPRRLGVAVSRVSLTPR
mgnify:CR=1 FL=1